MKRTIKMRASCDEGGKKKAGCEGKCIDGQNICVHLLVEVMPK